MRKNGTYSMNKNDIFERLFDVSTSSDLLDDFLRENMQCLYDFYNLNHNTLLQSKDSIERFILLKHSYLTQLDYSKSHSKAFVLMLLDFCERFNFISATPRIYSIIIRYNIALNSRMQAALLFLYPKPKTNTELVEKFEPLCELLQFAIENEEDNNKKTIVTFLNYYGIIINDTNKEFARQVKCKIAKAIQDNTYEFLKAIPEILNIPEDDVDVAYEQIQTLVDIACDCITHTQEHTVALDDYIIEEGTDYEEQLRCVPCNFDDIRKISISNATGINTTNRGVKILESESELYEYLKRFGNMHKTKIVSALKTPFPQQFSTKINLIDWGCGQGLASMLFLEKFGCNSINQISLIEPSEISLRRAALHCKKYAPDIPLVTICKKIDDISKDDICLSSAAVTVHLFSNVLDIDDYSPQYLIEIIESIQEELNFYICVSPHIDDIKTGKLDSFMRYFKTNYQTFHLLREAQNTKYGTFWCCNNTFKSGLIKHGGYSNCYSYDVDGCSNKWTRVMRVFSVSK